MLTSRSALGGACHAIVAIGAASLVATAAYGAEGGDAQGTVRVVAVGHVMLGTDTPTPWIPDQPYALFDPMKPLLRHADVAVGNLAGVVSDKGVEKRSANNTNVFSFRMPADFDDVLQDAGFDVLHVANNHSLDFGREAFDDSLARVRAVGIETTGLVGDDVVFDVRGVRVRVVGFTQPYAPDFTSHHDVDAAAARVAAAARDADVVIATFHGGAEGASALHTPDAPEYLEGGEYRGRVVQLARRLVDAGADLVVGFGAHNLRAMEWYKGRIIAYALGNAVTYGPFNLRSPNRLAIALDVTLNAHGNITAATAHPYLMRYPGVPEADSRGAAVRYLAQLSRDDFPGSAVSFHRNGAIVIPDGTPDIALREHVGGDRDSPEEPPDARR